MHCICHYFQFDLRSQWKKQPLRLLGMVPSAEMQCESHSCPLYSITVWKMRRCEKCIKHSNVCCVRYNSNVLSVCSSYMFSTV